MYIYTPLCRYWIALYRYVLVFIEPHVDIELEDNKQFISNIPRKWARSKIDQETIKTNNLSKIHDDRICLGPFGFREDFSLIFSSIALY